MRCTLQWTDCWLKLPCLTHFAFLEPSNLPWKVWIRSIKNKLKISENYIKCNNVGYSNIEHVKFVIDRLVQWASYQIRNIAGCACAGNAGNVFPRRRLQRKPLVSDPGMHHGTCGHDACRDRLPPVGGKRSRHTRRMRTRNFPYLASGPFFIFHEIFETCHKNFLGPIKFIIEFYLQCHCEAIYSCFRM